MAISRALHSRFFITMAAAALFSVSAIALPIQEIIHDRAPSGQVTLIIDSNAKSDLDLLLVVDDSGSMGIHQQNLMKGVQALAQQLQTSFASAHVAVTTTSVCDGATEIGCRNGQFLGSNPVLKPNSPDFLNNLISTLAAVGTNGVPEESPFDATIAAISSPLTETTNTGFLRKNSHLGVVFVTDAEDQSKASGVEFIQFLENKKGTGHFSLSAFLATSDKCQRDEYKFPQKIVDVVTQVQGDVYDVCNPDYSTALSAIGAKLGAGVDRNIQLPYKPVVTSIIVKLGSDILVAGDIHNGWTYDSKTNMVILGEDVHTQVQPGAKIEITFTIK